MKTSLLAVFSLLPALALAETTTTTTSHPTTVSTTPHLTTTSPTTPHPVTSNSPAPHPATASPTAATGANPDLPDPATELQVMTERLKLSASQQAAIKPILAEEFNQRKAIRESKSLNDPQKRDREGEIHRLALQKIKALFTPEQMALIEAGQNNPGPSPTHVTTPASPPHPTTSTTASAAAPHTSPSPTATTAAPVLPDPATVLQYMTQKLNLSSSQQAAIKPLLAEQYNLEKAIREATILTDQEKRDEEGEIQRAAFQKIKTHFTPEQLALVDGGEKTSGASSTRLTTASTK